MQQSSKGSGAWTSLKVALSIAQLTDKPLFTCLPPESLMIRAAALLATVIERYV